METLSRRGETADGSIPPNLTGQTKKFAGGETVVAIGYGYYLKKELQFHSELVMIS